VATCHLGHDHKERLKGKIPRAESLVREEITPGVPERVQQIEAFSEGSTLSSRKFESEKKEPTKGEETRKKTNSTPVGNKKNRKVWGPEKKKADRD